MDEGRSAVGGSPVRRDGSIRGTVMLSMLAGEGPTARAALLERLARGGTPLDVD